MRGPLGKQGSWDVKFHVSRGRGAVAIRNICEPSIVEEQWGYSMLVQLSGKEMKGKEGSLRVALHLLADQQSRIGESGLEYPPGEGFAWRLHYSAQGF